MHAMHDKSRHVYFVMHCCITNSVNVNTFCCDKFSLIFTMGTSISPRRNGFTIQCNSIALVLIANMHDKSWSSSQRKIALQIAFVMLSKLVMQFILLVGCFCIAYSVPASYGSLWSFPSPVSRLRRSAGPRIRVSRRVAAGLGICTAKVSHS